MEIASASSPLQCRLFPNAALSTDVVQWPDTITYDLCDTIAYVLCPEGKEKHASPQEKLHRRSNFAYCYIPTFRTLPGASRNKLLISGINDFLALSVLFVNGI